MLLLVMQAPWKMDRVRREATEALDGDPTDPRSPTKVEDEDALQEKAMFEDAYRKAKERYADDNAMAYTNAYDKAKEIHASVLPARMKIAYGPGPGQSTIGIHPRPLTSSLVGSRSPSPARPKEIRALCRDPSEWQGPQSPSSSRPALQMEAEEDYANAAMPLRSLDAINASISRLDRSIFDIPKAGFRKEGEWIPSSPEAYAAVEPGIRAYVPKPIELAPQSSHTSVDLASPTKIAVASTLASSRSNTGSWRDFL